MYNSLWLWNSQIYDVHISPRCICKSKQKLKVDFFTTPRQKSLPGPYHHLLRKSFHELLNIKLLQMCICDKQRYNFNRIYRYV